MKKLKVLFLTNIPAPYRIEFWNELGKYVDLYVWFQALGNINVRWDISHINMNYKYDFLKEIRVHNDMRINPEIIRKLRSNTFDVYIMGGYSNPTEMLAIRWLKANRIPYILNSDGGFIKKDTILKGWIKRKFISSASLWLSSGSHCTDYLVHYGAKKEYVYEYPFSSVFTGSDQEIKRLSQNEKDEIKRQMGLNKIVVLTIGQLIYRKGIDILLEAFKTFDKNDVSLIIIGRGPLKEKFLKYIHENNMKNVLLMDFMNYFELGKYYQISDIFVFPTRYDIWGLVLNEAITFGLPVISSNVAGASYSLIKEAQNGYIFKSGDKQDLKNKLESLIYDEALRKEFGKASKMKAAEYTIGKMAAAHVEAINKFYREFME